MLAANLGGHKDQLAGSSFIAPQKTALTLTHFVEGTRAFDGHVERSRGHMGGLGDTWTFEGDTGAQGGVPLMRLRLASFPSGGSISSAVP